MIIEKLKSKSNSGGYTTICKCDYCGKEFNRPYSGINENQFCKKVCYDKWLIGSIPWNKGSRMPKGYAESRIAEGNPNWKGGRKIEGGYVAVKMYDNRYSQNYIKEHRLIMEKHLGRYLKSEEIVHHINENKIDNRLENLMLFSNVVEHLKWHKENGVV